MTQKKTALNQALLAFVSCVSSIFLYGYAGFKKKEETPKAFMISRLTINGFGVPILKIGYTIYVNKIP